MNQRRLWAPWRITYVSKIKKEKGCLFCRVLKSRLDTKNMVILRSQHSFAMLNLYPYNNGHIMVAPNRHIRSLENLNQNETTDLINTLKKAKALLDKTLKPQGYNIGANIGRVSGAGIEGHLHLHIVPRWLGDTNFMPTLFDTKIIAQSLEELYKILLRNK